LLSFRGISTPSLPAQGEQRRSSYFNIPRGNSLFGGITISTCPGDVRLNNENLLLIFRKCRLKT
jgi:hypothetical protein